MPKKKAKKKAKATRCARPGSLSYRERKLLPDSAFALPRERKYPLYVFDYRTGDAVPSGSHASNAKSRAAQQFALGNLTLAQYERVTREADKVLKKCKATGEKRLTEALKGAT